MPFIFVAERVFGGWGRWAAVTATIMASAAAGIVRFVASMADFGFLMGLGIVNYAVIGLRKRMPNLRRPFTGGLYPWVPLLGVAHPVGTRSPSKTRLFSGTYDPQRENPHLACVFNWARVRYLDENVLDKRLAK